MFAKRLVLLLAAMIVAMVVSTDAQARDCSVAHNGRVVTMSVARPGLATTYSFTVNRTISRVEYVGFFNMPASKVVWVSRNSFKYCGNPYTVVVKGPNFDKDVDWYTHNYIVHFEGGGSAPLGFLANKNKVCWGTIIIDPR